MTWDEQLYSSRRQDWATPVALYEALNMEFNFGLDAAASPDNAKCPNFLTEHDDALHEDWSVISNGKPVFLNPPYGRQIERWMEKAYLESLNGVPVVCLTFARTDTQWWHRWVMRAAEIRFIPGRITFEGAPAGAPAPSCVIVFDESKRWPRMLAQSLPRR